MRLLACYIQEVGKTGKIKSEAQEQEMKHTKDLFVGFCCGNPGHWVFRCPARLPVRLMGGLAEPQYFRSKVVFCTKGEPSQLPMSFGTTASGVVVKFPVSPRSGVFFER